MPAQTQHTTLGAGEVESLTFDEGATFEGVITDTPSSPVVVWYTLNGEDPVPNGDDTYAIAGGVGAWDERPCRRSVLDADNTQVVKLLCSVAATVQATVKR